MDPAGYVDGMNLYAYVNNNVANRVDPFGLTPCFCGCEGIEKDASGEINQYIQRIIDSVPKKHKSYEKAFLKAMEASKVSPQNAIESHFEQLIEDGEIDGRKKCKESRGIVREYTTASVMKVCGYCIGTDKLGHFIQEGLTSYALATSRGETFAVDLSYWLEGIYPPNGGFSHDFYTSVVVNASPIEFYWNGKKVMIIMPQAGFYGDEVGGVVLDPKGSASPADIAANLSGMLFWEDLSNASGLVQFDICKYVNEQWDQTLTPNVPGVPRGTVLPQHRSP